MSEEIIRLEFNLNNNNTLKDINLNQQAKNIVIEKKGNVLSIMITKIVSIKKIVQVDRINRDEAIKRAILRYAKKYNGGISMNKLHRFVRGTRIESIKDHVESLKESGDLEEFTKDGIRRFSIPRKKKNPAKSDNKSKDDGEKEETRKEEIRRRIDTFGEGYRGDPFYDSFQEFVE